MSPIVDFTTETTREQEWDNIACVHQDTQVASTWSFHSQKMGETLLRHPRFKQDQHLRQAVATCLCLTACGNFVYIGYSSGHVDKFNIQSGLHRGQLVDSSVETAPASSIRGVVSDALNQYVITGDASGRLRYWRFSNHQLLCQPEQLESGIQQMALHRDNGLLAVATADFGLLVIDSVVRRVVRRFEVCHTDHITDFCFSADCQWILTASLDATVKVWDVPSGTLVDHASFPRAVTSLSMSPQNNYLATSHVGDLGIYLWVNKTVYGRVALRPLKEDELPRTMAMPTVLCGQDDMEPDNEYETAHDEDQEMYDEDWTAKQIGQLVTLSNLPASRWQHLLNLDVIKARNKPQNPVAKPVSAPFFLPTIPTLNGEPRFVIPDDNEDQAAESKVLNSVFDAGQTLSEFGQLVWDGGDHGAALDVLKDKGPSAIEIEIKNLSPEGGGSVQLMEKFLRFVAKGLESKFHFDLVQSYLALFLKLHGDSAIEHASIAAALKELQDVQEQSWTELKSDMKSGASLISFCKSSLIT